MPDSWLVQPEPDHFSGEDHAVSKINNVFVVWLCLMSTSLATIAFCFVIAPGAFVFIAVKMTFPQLGWQETFVRIDCLLLAASMPVIGWLIFRSGTHRKRDQIDVVEGMN